MEYKKGELLEFNIYGTTVKGEFISIDENLIKIKTIKDFIKENIGEEQTVFKTDAFDRSTTSPISIAFIAYSAEILCLLKYVQAYRGFESHSLRKIKDIRSRVQVNRK